MVGKMLKTYPRATDYLGDLVGIDNKELAEMFQQELIDWYKVKKLYRGLDELLHNRIVVNPREIHGEWRRCTKTS